MRYNFASFFIDSFSMHTKTIGNIGYKNIVMATFREGIENIKALSKKAIVEKDVIELGAKIQAFKEGKIAEDKFNVRKI